MLIANPPAPNGRGHEPGPERTTAARPGGVLAGTGRGVATAHHGELFQGQIRDASGALRRCLLSLPCSHLYSHVTFHPHETATVTVHPPDKGKTRTAIELTLAYLDATGIGGNAIVESNIVEGKGYGSSTADCVAAVRAVADAFGQRLSDEDVAHLAVSAEAASDNTMFDRAVLFAQRDGIVVEDYLRPVPRMEVVGFDTDRGGIVETLRYPPAVYSRLEIQMFHTLVAALRRAIRTQDAPLLGRVATASAIVNERFLPKPMFAETCRLAKDVGAIGIAAAHSGTVLSVLFDPAHAACARQIEALQRGLVLLGVREIVQFRTWVTCLKAVAGSSAAVGR